MRLQFDTINGIRFDSRIAKEKAGQLASDLLANEKRITAPENIDKVVDADKWTFIEHRSTGSSTAFTRYPFTPIAFLAGAMSQEEIIKRRGGIESLGGYMGGILDVNTLGLNYDSKASLHNVNLDIDDSVRDEFVELIRSYVDGLCLSKGEICLQGILYCYFKGTRTVTFEKGGKIEMPNMIWFQQWIPTRKRLDLSEHVSQGVKLKDYRCDLNFGDEYVFIDEFGVRFEQKNLE